MVLFAVLVVDRKRQSNAVVEADPDQEDVVNENDMDVDEVEEDEEEEESSSDDDESVDEPPAPRRPPPRSASPRRPRRAAEKQPGDNDDEIQPRSRPAAKSSSSSSSSLRGPSPAVLRTALSALAAKVLDRSETQSLVASLLLCYEKKRGGKTAALQQAARRVLSRHLAQPHEAQCQLLNLLFRSVGGSVESNLDLDTNLEALPSEEWVDLVGKVVEAMEETPVEHVLFCTDPLGAVHEAAVAAATTAADSTENKTHKSSVGRASWAVREYRNIYQEFWYWLARTALTENVQEDSDSSSAAATTTTHGVVQVDLVRDIMSRIIEMLGTVGQPDMRAAATVAIYQMGVAMLEHTNTLNAKVATAQRQLDVARKTKSTRKAQAVQHQMTNWQRVISDLEVMVKETVGMGVFMKRYRDSNPHIRAASLQALSRFTLIRPDLFLVGTYLKYFGWMLNDKSPTVRVEAIRAFMAPFLQVESLQSSSSSPHDACSQGAPKLRLAEMQKAFARFLPRLADCTMDVSWEVQEVAMELILKLLHHGQLDSFQDDEFWKQLNRRALEENTTPSVRRQALYIVTAQLGTFDSFPSEAEAALTECIQDLSHWYVLEHTLAYTQRSSSP
jgi:cohesin complex subunit SA-1/2